MPNNVGRTSFVSWHMIDLQVFVIDMSETHGFFLLAASKQAN